MPPNATGSCPHTADGKFQAFGATLEEAFGNAALATASLMWDWTKVEPRTRYSVRVRARDLEQLLVKFLGEVIYLFETQRFLLGEVASLTIERGGGATPDRSRLHRGRLSRPLRALRRRQGRDLQRDEDRGERLRPLHRPGRGRHVGAMELRKIDDNTWEIPRQGDDARPGRRLCVGEAPQGHPPRPDPGAGPERRLPAGHPADVLSSCPTPTRATAFPSAASPPSTSTKAIISPGGVGYDINCGVRLLATGLPGGGYRRPAQGAPRRDLQGGPGRRRQGRRDEAQPRRPPRDPGRGGGMGRPERLRPSRGPRADRRGRPDDGAPIPAGVSDRAMERGIPQLGTLGAGNHFLEIQKVAEIFDAATARAFGIAGDGPDHRHDPLREPGPRPPGRLRLHRAHGERARDGGPSRPGARQRALPVGPRPDAITAPCAPP